MDFSAGEFQPGFFPERFPEIGLKSAFGLTGCQCGRYFPLPQYRAGHRNHMQERVFPVSSTVKRPFCAGTNPRQNNGWMIQLRLHIPNDRFQVFRHRAVAGLPAVALTVAFAAKVKTETVVSVSGQATASLTSMSCGPVR
jgi:hypothetical protein